MARPTTNSEFQMDRLEEESEFWDLYREVMAEKGVDISRFYAAAAERVKHDFSTKGAKADFSELCSLGCSREVLAFLAWLFRSSPRITDWWNCAVGDRSKRQKTKISLENAASAIESVFAPILNADERIKEKLVRSRFLMPKELIAQLHLYARLITLGERLAENPGIRSLAEFVRYLLVGYVKRSTGKFCDRNVSGLIAELGGPAEYDEVAQRMWRRRNYERLDEHLSGLADGLNAMGIVMSGKTEK